MTAAEPIFPKARSAAPARADGAIEVIETEGVEVLLDWPARHANDAKLAANHNDVIPFASTLRRVG